LTEFPFDWGLLVWGPLKWGPPRVRAPLSGGPLEWGPLSVAPLSGSLHLHKGSLLEVFHTRIGAFLSGSQFVWGPPLVRAPLSEGASVGAPLIIGPLEWGPP
jgi:hypothetical protein